MVQLGDLFVLGLGCLPLEDLYLLRFSATVLERRNHQGVPSLTGLGLDELRSILLQKMSVDGPILHHPCPPGLDLRLVVESLHDIFSQSSFHPRGILMFLGGNEVKDVMVEGRPPSEPSTGDLRQFVDDLPARLEVLKRTLLVPFSQEAHFGPHQLRLAHRFRRLP
jgi:hypothetical protein